MCCQSCVSILVNALLKMITWVFFRTVGQFGSHQVPKHGPVIFVCAPHANQFLDPLIVQQQCGRPVGFLAAQKSVDRQCVGKIIKAMNAIGVTRSQDCRRNLPGTVVSVDLKVIKGTGTQFTTAFEDGDQLFIASTQSTHRVEQVRSDTELVLKDPLEEVLLDPSRIKAEPKLDQTAVFDTVFETLHQGKCIGIFPEGGSHDRASMLPLKAGVTIMALGAVAKYPSLRVAIVPVGLNYFHAHRFRSQAYADFGAPFYVEPEMVEKYKNKATKREACAELLAQIQERLAEVTVNTRDHQTKAMLIMARRLYKPVGKELTVAERLELNRRFAAALEHFGDEPLVTTIMTEVQQYRDMLKAYSLRDYQVENMHASAFRSGVLLVWRVIQVLLMFPLGLPGAVLYAPVALLANHISEKKAAEALAGSTVKVKGNDVLATWKVMVATVVIPLMTIFYTIIIALVVAVLFEDEPLWMKIALPIVSLLILPLLGYTAIRLAETGMQHVYAIRPLFWTTFQCCCGNHEVWTLKMYRDHLQGSLLKMVETLGPKMYGSQEAFERQRIIQHSDFNHKFSLIQTDGGGLVASSSSHPVNSEEDDDNDDDDRKDTTAITAIEIHDGDEQKKH